MWLRAGMASTKGAFLSHRSTTSGTGNSKGLLWVRFSDHGAKDNAKDSVMWMFNFEQLVTEDV
jgi:hypothetical protein